MEQERDFTTLHVRDYLFIIAKRKKSIIILVILAILSGILGSRKQAPVYQARAKIMVETGETIISSQGKRTAGVYHGENYSGTEKYENEYEVMRSPIVAEKTAEMLGWTDSDAAEYVHDAVEISPVQSNYQSSNITFVIARDADPKKAMDMANYTMKAYLVMKENETKDTIKKIYEIYAQQIQELKDKTQDAEMMFDEYKKKYNLEGLENELNKQQSELLSLLNVYTEKHPLVVEKKAQIEDIRNRLKNTLPLEDPESTDDKELRFGKARSEYYVLQRDIASNKELYDYLVSNIKELNVSKQMSKLGAVRILEWATLPVVPEKKQNVVLFFAPFVGLFLGISLAFFLEYMDNSIKTEQDVKQYLDLPTIGVIQHIKEDIK